MPNQHFKASITERYGNSNKGAFLRGQRHRWWSEGSLPVNHPRQKYHPSISPIRLCMEAAKYWAQHAIQLALLAWEADPSFNIEAAC